MAVVCCKIIGRIIKLTGISIIGMVTSGDVAHRYLSTRPGPEWKALGSRVLHITWAERGSIQLNDLNLEVGMYGAWHKLCIEENVWLWMLYFAMLLQLARGILEVMMSFRSGRGVEKTAEGCSRLPYADMVPSMLLPTEICCAAQA